MRIIVDQTFDTKKFGLFCVYFEVNQLYFPDVEWLDFYLAIIADWCSEVLIHKDLMVSQFDLFFMDGPYRLRVEKNGNMCTIIGMHEEKKLFSETERYNVLTDMLVHEASNLLLKVPNLSDSERKILTKLITN